MSPHPLAAGAAALRRIGALLLAAALAGVLVAGLVLPLAGLTGFTARQVSDGIENLPEELEVGEISHTSKIYDSNGHQIARFYTENRDDVALRNVAPLMRKAIVAIEDSRFFQHGAIDLEGTSRALINNLLGNDTQGGSSITQQLIKLILIEKADTKAQLAAATEQSYTRKIRELQYAMSYEQNHSKSEILEDYLNIAFFGDGAYGIKVAARHYFSVKPADLSLAQSALLAGLVQNPTRFNPSQYPDLALERRNIVLQRMAELDIVSRQQAHRAMTESLGLDPTNFSNGCVTSPAPFFCDYVHSYLLANPALGKTRREREDTLRTGGLTIHTTVDLRFQRAADQAVRDRVNPTDLAIGGMAMVVPGTGEVKALSQSRPMGNNVRAGQTYLNFVVPKEYGDANGFQGGSTFKVFTLSSALKQGYPLSTSFTAPSPYYVPAGTLKNCAGDPLGSWSLQNSTGTPGARYTMYTGTQQSVNSFYAQLEQLTGVCPPVTLAREMGVEIPETQEVPSFTLGVSDVNPVTMAGVYATFAARGIYCKPHPVTGIVDSQGKQVDTGTPRCDRVMGKPVADAVNDILRGVIEPGGFAEGAALNQPAAGKTGTTNDNYSVWFDGYTPNLATATMIAGVDATNQPAPITNKTIGGQYITFDAASGSGLAAPMWAQAMRAVQQWLPDAGFHFPDTSELGEASVTVPALGGLSIDNASAQLRSLGLEPVVGSTVDSSYAQGSVAYTTPGAGQTAYEGQTITLSISDGTPYVPPTTQPPTSQPPTNPQTPPNPGNPGGGNGGGGPGGGPGGGEGGGEGGPGNGNGNGNAFGNGNGNGGGNGNGNGGGNGNGNGGGNGNG